MKGSEWRKWDLHVHTPASFHWTGGKKLRNLSLGEKEIEFQKLYETINSSDIAVFCFMDYWTFEGYIQFKQFLVSKGIELSKTIFPGMELRVEAPVDYRLNIHVILSDSLSTQQLKDFQTKLKIGSLDRQISEEAIKEFAVSLDPSKAKHHGFTDPNELDEEQLLLLGSITVEITKESLKDAMNSIPAGSGFILLPYDTSDGLKNLDWKTQPHADNYFMQSANLFESRDEETIQLFLGIKTERNKHFIDNFQKTLGGIPKPVICGSDAHGYSNYGVFPNNKATWIKADPTFEGFKQIIYEPIQRVCINESIPEEKTPYLVIDKVRFLDRTGTNRFQNKWIELNPNLNVIIGGKSSGKSLLLYHIAKTISPYQTEEKSKEINGNVYNEFSKPDQFDFEVLWKDCHINSLNESSENKNRKITFIPQMYINFLAEKQGQKNLIELIDSILEQNEIYKIFIDSAKQRIYELKVLINQDISDLIELREEYKKIVLEIKEIGDKNAILNEIKRLNEQIEVLKTESGFNEEENKIYEKLNQKLLFCQKKRENSRNLKDCIFSLQQHVINLKNNFNSSIKDKYLQYYGLNAKVANNFETFTTSRLNNAIDETLVEYESFNKKMVDKILKFDSLITELTKELEPYKAKIKNRELLQRLCKSLGEQQLKIVNIEKKEAEILGVRERGKSAKEQLFLNYSNLFEVYKTIENELIKEDYCKIADNIELESSLKFDSEKFSETFTNLFDGRCNLETIFGECFNDNNDFYFKPETHIENIKNIFDILSSSPSPGSPVLRFRKGITQNEASEKLFGNYFKIEYNIKHKCDDILKMSPGKRGLVLLQLILHISNATHPILIDQPEDNLDNRTIYIELKEFIKEKKTQRQIILVTHNANLVVSTDTENVIVANQSGQQINKENKEYQFEYVSGSLENTFVKEEMEGILYQFGIREHVCDILEGGKEAFIKREQKYGLRV